MTLSRCVLSVLRVSPGVGRAALCGCGEGHTALRLQRPERQGESSTGLLSLLCVYFFFCLTDRTGTASSLRHQGKGTHVGNGRPLKIRGIQTVGCCHIV